MDSEIVTEPQSKSSLLPDILLTLALAAGFGAFMLAGMLTLFGGVR